jgi:hypothetical protein
VTIYEYLLIGSYAFSALWSWRLIVILNRIDARMARQEGLQEGWNLDERVTRLERLLERAS